MGTATVQKIFGAFYTDERVARAIVAWALRTKDDRVLDPSCGEGVFLSAASEHLQGMGSEKPEIWGVDIDGEAVAMATAHISESKVIKADFFSLRTGDIPFFDAVVGNPPFIRYQSFNGTSRASGLACAREAGVELAQLSSSWAPFLIHAVSFLKRGGRLGMVVPAELGHARYAKQVLGFLFRKFGRIQLRIFREKLFPELSEDTALLLCEEFENPCSRLSVTLLKNLEGNEAETAIEHPVDIEAIRTGRVKFSHYLLSSKARQLYENLAREKQVVALGAAADVGIGYVTGHNDFFHLSVEESLRWGIPRPFLRPAILSMADSRGTVIRQRDWQDLRDEGKKCYLLNIPAKDEMALSPRVRKYLNQGKTLEVPERFKCRVRDVWYSVPHVRVADAFLSYMSGQWPRLVRNGASLVAPNTLHLVRFEKGWKASSFIAGWYSSLTRLSCELEGHALGGGMLKLEPSEAEEVLVAMPYPAEAPQLAKEVDVLSRRKEDENATEHVDRRVLRRRLGLSGTECLILREAAAEMHKWRMHK
jgi:adenine-specific DNA methylase